MSTVIIDLSEITDICNYFKIAPFPFYETFRTFFNVLWDTGCRPAEAFDITRWSFLSGSDCDLHPLKGNNIRTVSLAAASSSFLDCVINQTTPFQGLTLFQVQNLFDRIKLFHFLYSGDKVISLYIYRYRFVKQLYADGVPLATIAIIMGYTSTSTPQSYIDAVISMSFNLPLSGHALINGYSIDKFNLAWTDGGPGICYPLNNFHCSRFFGLHYSFDAALRAVAAHPGSYLASDFIWVAIYNAIKNLPIDQRFVKCDLLPYWLPSNSMACNAYGLDLRGSGYTSSSVPFYFNTHLYLRTNVDYIGFRFSSDSWFGSTVVHESSRFESIRLFYVV